jgi:hypothetical protein
LLKLAKTGNKGSAKSKSTYRYIIEPSLYCGFCHVFCFGICFFTASKDSFLKAEGTMFENAVEVGIYMLVLFFGVAFAIIILTGFYWSRRIKSIYLNKRVRH